MAQEPAAVRMRGERKASFLTRSFRSPPYWGLAVLSPILVLVVWEAAVVAFGVSTIILPSPIQVAVALWQYVLSGTFFSDVFSTLWRVFVGLVIGSVVGACLGLLMGYYAPVRAFFRPLISLTFPIPKIALVPLLVIWFGTGDSFKIVLAIIGVFYILLTNAFAAVDEIPKSIILAAMDLGASDFQLLRKVIFPATLPVLFAGLRIAFAVALILVIAAEMQVSTNGLGYFLVFAGQLMKTESVFAGLVVTAIIGIIGYWVIDFCERLAVPQARG